MNDPERAAPPEGWLTLKEAGNLVGRTDQTINSWIGSLIPETAVFRSPKHRPGIFVDPEAVLVAAQLRGITVSRTEPPLSPPPAASEGGGAAVELTPVEATSAEGSKPTAAPLPDETPGRADDESGSVTVNADEGRPRLTRFELLERAHAAELALERERAAKVASETLLDRALEDLERARRRVRVLAKLLGEEGVDVPMLLDRIDELGTTT